ncbi:serine/threonine protein kinase [Arabiibacter massiliensis]|uniref:serine/threonine protein kinase n=1 Tax=Arabiibacter massiliensis TaxID=1870985 RepID=UPI00155A7E79|nr:serine/threonine-protein kinase [Arabiibacter massiliensis]
MHEELAEHLDSLARDDCYRVDAVLKEGPFETTQRVFFVGANGAEQGPYVRKYLDGEAGLGAAYERIGQAQRAGRRFLHLPQIIDWYAVGDRRAVVMEHVRGETLADAVYRCDPSVELAYDLFPRLCEAVRELHEGFDPPIIHRDLKPSNIMVTQDGLTVIDFGIARTFDEEAEEDTRRFGTRAYAPPEQFGFGQTDVRSDVYALGMLLYFCLTEKTPDAKARKERFRSPQVPEPLRLVIERATAFDPEARYASVVELERAFAAAEGALGVGGAATPQPAPAPAPLPAAKPAAPRSVRTTERLPLWVGVVWDMAILLLLALFALVAGSLALQPEAGSSMAAESIAYRAVAYGSLVVLFFWPALLVLRDRRPLRRIAPHLPEPRLRTELLVVLAGFAVCVLVFGVLDLFGI